MFVENISTCISSIFAVKEDRIAKNEIQFAVKPKRKLSVASAKVARKASKQSLVYSSEKEWEDTNFVDDFQYNGISKQGRKSTQSHQKQQVDVEMDETETSTRRSLNEFTVVEISDLQINVKDLVKSTVTVVFEKDGINYEPETQQIHFLTILPIFQDYVKSVCPPDMISRFENELYWQTMTYITKEHRYKFHFLNGKTSPHEYTLSEAIALTNDADLLQKVAKEVKAMTPNTAIIWHTRDGYDQFLAGSRGMKLALANDTTKSLDALPKGEWPFKIVQFDRQWCSIAALESCTNGTILKKYPNVRKYLKRCQNEDGMADFSCVISAYNKTVKCLNWRRLNDLFQRNKFTSIRTCFNLFLQFENVFKFYIISFLCGTTCHIISIEACKNLILDTDSGMGRQEAFHYEDIDDVAIIMNRLFSVDINLNIVSNIYVREMTG